MTAPVILSPHRDDAVLSLWHVLASEGDVRVLNVFSGRPDGSAGTSWWDRLTGAGDPVARWRERRDEDARALARAGRVPEDLDLVGAQHRSSELPAEAVAERVAAAAGDAGVLYAPGALDGHPSHRLVLAAARLLAQPGERDLRVYADIPHALAFGWPAWVTGAAPRAHLDPGAHWDHRLRAAGLRPQDLEARVHRLGREAVARKREAIRQYRTQLPALEAQFGDFTRAEVLAYEVVWSPRA